MKDKLARIAPLGINLNGEISFFAGVMAFGVFDSLSVLGTYFYVLDGFYEQDRNGNKYLLDNMIMPYFKHFIDDSYKGFIVAIVCMAGLAAYHYFYHYQESKGIYLMKRLPKRSELHKRCLGVPIVGSLVIVATAVFLYVMYYAIYLFCTPPQCLPF